MDQDLESLVNINQQEIRALLLRLRYEEIVASGFHALSLSISPF